MCKVVIIEDDPRFRKELAGILSAIQDTEVIGTFARGEEFFDRIQDLRPEILFLDIGLPGISGIQVADRVRRDFPFMDIVFITADENHTKEAFRLYASDYITKPIDSMRLRQTLARIQRKPVLSEMKIELKCGEEVHLLPQEDIFMVEALAKKTTVYTATRTLICLQSLKEMETSLDKHVFFRTSRSYLVNLKWVEAVKPCSRTSYQVLFRGKKYLAYLQKNLYPEFRTKIKDLYKEEVRNHESKVN